MDESSMKQTYHNIQMILNEFINPLILLQNKNVFAMSRLKKTRSPF